MPFSDTDEILENCCDFNKLEMLKFSQTEGDKKTVTFFCH